MKIVQLDIQGFRSLKNVSWRPGDLNVIIGPNGSGKSNLLKMLELISAAAQGKLSDYVQRSGGMSAIVWDGQAIDIKWQTEISPSITPSLFTRRYSMDMQSFDSSYKIAEEQLETTDLPTKDQSETAVSNLLARHYQIALYHDDNRKPVGVPKVAISEEETLLSLATNQLTFKNQLFSVFNDYLKASYIYQDLRTDQNAPIRQAVVTRLEQRVAPDGQNLINVLHTLYTSNRDFKQDINDAMSAAFGADFDELIFPPAADQRIQMRVRWKTLKREQSTADLSDGTLRFLFLMTVLASPNPPPLIAIDEPETGLHPSMLPIIAEFAVEAARRTQVIFTTHSDQFLDAFHTTKPTTTVAKWENGETILKTIEGETLDYWLQQFTLGSLFRSGELEDMGE